MQYKSSSSDTHVHEQQLHLVLSDPPPDALPRPEAEGQRAEARPGSSLALLSAFAPSAGLKALRVLKDLCAPPQGVKAGLDHRLGGDTLKQTHWVEALV